MNRCCSSPFADWLGRNNMDCFFRKGFLTRSQFLLTQKVSLFVYSSFSSISSLAVMINQCPWLFCIWGANSRKIFHIILWLNFNRDIFSSAISVRCDTCWILYLTFQFLRPQKFSNVALNIGQENFNCGVNFTHFNLCGDLVSIRTQ